MKNDNKLLIIGLIVAVIIVGLLISANEESVITVEKPENNVTENKIQKVDNKVQSKTENKGESNVKNTVNNNNIVENTIKVQNTVQEENIVQKEKTENTISNVTTNSQAPKEDNNQKAINMVKQDWGEDASVTFKIDEKKENEKYVVSVVDKNTTEVLVWYDVDVKNNTIQVR